MQPYFQTTSFTTAASSLLAIMHHLKPEISLNRDNEFRIWHSSVNLPTRGSSIFGLANYAWNKGIKLKVIVEKTDYSFPDYRFYRYTKEDVDNASFSHNSHLLNAKTQGIPIEEREILLEDIQNELSQGNILLLRINAKHIRTLKRNTSNYVIVTGYQDNYFHLLDPIIGGISIPKETMQEAFESLEEKKYRDHRMIVFYK
jgi:hypothetical protein